jgi:hypothetical protein
MPRCFLNLVALLFLPFLFSQSSSGAGQETPGQEIWYHTGYPGGVGGPPSGMSALTGPTKMPAISMILPDLIRRQNPDLILYQAGMDPYDGAGISAKALAVRDAYVFALARSLNKPMTWVLAGGYSDLATLVRLHTGTVRMVNEVLARVKPGDRIDLRGENPYDWFTREKVVVFPDWKSILHGNPQVSKPESMTDAQAQEFVAARQRLFRDQRLPDEEIRSAYRTLFLVTP